MERYMNIQYGKLNLAATLHYPSFDEDGTGGPRHPVIVVCHGFAGNRIGQERLFVKAARQFTDNGYLVLRFDYAGCGESTGDYGATAFHEFIDQTRYVLDYVLDLDFVDPSRVTLLGHSLGGAVSLLTATRDKRITSLLLWAPVAHPFLDIVNIAGRATYEEAITKGSSEYLGYSLRKMFFETMFEYNPLKEASSFTGDILLVHGTADESVPADHSLSYEKVLLTRDRGQCDKEILTQANHSFSTKGHSAEVIRKSLDWLEKTKHQKDVWYGWGI